MYNRIMGDTDGLNQAVEVFWPYLKTVSWVTSFFTHVLTLVETNAFIWIKSYQDQNDLQFKKKTYSHKDWRLDVVNNMCVKQLQKQELEECHIKERTQDKKKWNKDFSRLRGRHFPMEIPLNNDQNAVDGVQTRHTQEEFDAALKR